MNWEYREVIADRPCWSENTESAIEAMQRMGAEGWECIEKKPGTYAEWIDSVLTFGIPCTKLTFKRAQESE